MRFTTRPDKRDFQTLQLSSTCVNMSDLLPPLTALRAFEAAARHLSFARAAEELSVTPAALSFQIKSLEDHLGQPVFRRLNRAVELTELGRALHPGLSDGFSAISAAWRTARRQTSTSSLTVTAGPAFTANWLAPRLFRFASAHPEIELKFVATLRSMDFDRDEVDVAIRFGRKGQDKGLYSRTLIDEWVTPMIHPSLSDQIKSPQDLAAFPVLMQDDTQFLEADIGWDKWFEAMGEPIPDLHGPHFSQADHALGAAMSAVGVIMGRVSLAERFLRDGQLVMPFAETLWVPASYRILCPSGQETRPHIATFIDWIVSEVTDLDDLLGDRVFLNDKP